SSWRTRRDWSRSWRTPPAAGRTTRRCATRRIRSSLPAQTSARCRCRLPPSASRWGRASSRWSGRRWRSHWWPTSSSVPGRRCAPPRATPPTRPDCCASGSCGTTRERPRSRLPPCFASAHRETPRPAPLACDAPRGRVPSVVAFDLGLQVVLLADARDQCQLGLQPVDVFFLGLEDVGEQPAADEVTDLLAVGDRLLERRDGLHFQGE